jgi:hypothetical protein
MLRQLHKNPGFTAVAVSTLTPGIGANTAVFSVLNGGLLKMLPVRQPAELVQLEETDRAPAFNSFSYPAYLRLRGTNRVFPNLFGWAIRGMNAKFGGEVEPASAALSSRQKS